MHVLWKRYLKTNYRDRTRIQLASHIFDTSVSLALTRLFQSQDLPEAWDCSLYLVAISRALSLSIFSGSASKGLQLSVCANLFLEATT